MDNLTFQYPTWYIIFCMLLGLGFALVLYYRNRSFRDQSRQLNWILGIIRFITVTLLSMLLLSPLLRSLVTETKKPIVVLAQDQSESIKADMDSTALLQYQEEVQNLSNALSEKYELKQYAFGDEVREGIDFQFTDKVSNLSNVFSQIYDVYSNQNLGAVILATDGIYNEGSNPAYIGTKLSAPIYTIALGDTTPKRDVIIRRVFHNKIAYLGDRFGIQIDIAAHNCQGSSSVLSIAKMENGKARKLQDLPITINSNDFFSTQEITLNADQPGVQRYRISLTPVANEVTTANNSKDIFIDVLDARQKILILAATPHPDISAIKQSLLKNKNYEVTSDFADQFSKNLSEFDFVILHQLPSLKNKAATIIQSIQQRKIPHLFVVGTQTDLKAFNQMQSVITINSGGPNTNDVQAAVASNFSLFKIDEKLNTELPKFAPLTAPFGEFKDNANTQVLLYQRIGKIDTKYPLLLFGEQSGQKTGVLCAEGIWKWRLFDYMQNQNHNLFEEVLGKSIQYLSLKNDKRRFRVNIAKNIFNENEEITFDAELYNESYELINGPDISLTITNSEGREFDFTFNKTSNAYSLNAGYFPVGNYTYRSSVMASGQQLTAAGQFSIRPIQLELYETTADHALLKVLGEKHGGDLVYPGQIASIAQLIENKETVKPLIYQTTKTRSIINLKWLFFLFLGLLTIEWFLRRYYGSY